MFGKKYLEIIQNDKLSNMLLIFDNGQVLDEIESFNHFLLNEIKRVQKKSPSPDSDSSGKDDGSPKMKAWEV